MFESASWTSLAVTTPPKPDGRSDRPIPAPETPATLPSDVSLLIVATLAHTVQGFLRPYAAHFRAHGWRVDAAANGASSDERVLQAFDHAFELPLSRSILDIRGLLRGERAFARILESSPDIVHVHTPIAAFIARLAVARMPADRRPKVVYTAHGFHFYRGGRALTNRAFLLAEKIAGRWTDRLIVINAEDYEAARRNRIVRAGRLVRMPGIGVDTGHYSRSRLEPGAIDEARRHLGVAAGTPLVVAVGELNRNKRQEDAIDALAMMRRQDATLVIAGRGYDQDRLEQIVRNRLLGDRVVFAGYIPDIRPVIATATAVVLASKREGLARSIMEALSLEVPVVASTARGNAELIASDAGFIFQTGDTAALASHLDWLIEHPAEAQQMGRQGRARMVESYDIGNLLTLHEELYAALLDERRHADG